MRANKPWTADEDQYVLDLIANQQQGETKTRIWERASRHLGRTKQAVAFRWVNVLSKQEPNPEPKEVEGLASADIINFILGKDQQIRQLKQENYLLKEENERLKQQEKDFKDLLQIVERARKSAFLGEEEPTNKPRFRMDANGNLERM